MDDKKYMQRALSLAVKGAGFVAPNPMVGCVIVKDGHILSEGWHAKYGDEHAEQMALRRARENMINLDGATAYVTLEPCNHYGKTPPCSEALINAGIKKVFIACRDPHIKASGGEKRLLQAGIAVETGLCEEEAKTLNEAFFYHSRTGMPFVTWKVAATADGCVSPGLSSKSPADRQISGPKAHAFVHRLRHQSSAIMIGSATLRSDNPYLSDRSGLHPPSHPKRIIVGHNPDDLIKSNILKTASDIPTVFAYAGHKKDTVEIEKAGVTCWHWEQKDVPLFDLLKKLGSSGINSILLEGGATLASMMVSNHLVQKVIILYAPLLLGMTSPRQAMLGPLGVHLTDACSLRKQSFSLLGEDMCYTAYLGGLACSQD